MVTVLPPRVAIIGGSLGGLAAGHALRKYCHVEIFERSPIPMDKKGSGLGFVDVSAWEHLVTTGGQRYKQEELQGQQRSRSIMMRRGKRAHRHQGSFYYGDLWNYLYQNLLIGDSIDHKNSNDDSSWGKTEAATMKCQVHFGRSVTKEQVDISGVYPKIDDKPYDLIILADGGFSSLRSAFVTDERPQYAGYICWRGSIPVSEVPPGIARQIQEGVYKNGHYDTIVLRMAKDNGQDLWTLGSFIATSEDELYRYQNHNHVLLDGRSRHDTTSNDSCTAPSSQKDDQDTQATISHWLEDHFIRNFHHVPGLPSLVQSIIRNDKGELKPHPQYEFGAKTIRNGRILLLGDAAHMASPRTAVGAHTAILDALALQEAFEIASSSSRRRINEQCNGDDDEHNKTNDHIVEQALQLYTPTGVQRAQELYHRSREVSRQFLPR